jgi:tripartite-type tricarboxylate transporter receptor subunit TctC
LIIIFLPGGGVDNMGRIVATRLSETLGQPVVPENRAGAGAGGNVGLNFVAKARPDGYTLIHSTESLTMSPGLYNKLNYDATKNFQPTAQTSVSPILPLAHSDFPAKTLKELVEYVKANPGRRGTAGRGRQGASTGRTRQYAHANATRRADGTGSRNRQAGGDGLVRAACAGKHTKGHCRPFERRSNPDHRDTRDPGNYPGSIPIFL